MTRCLIVTNDFPPRQGGIEAFGYELAVRFPPDELVVYTSAEPGAAEFDAAQPFPIVRDRSRTLLPLPAVARRARTLARRYDCDRVWFGAAAPLGLLAGRLREAGVRRLVATTHGHEVWWAHLPGTRRLLRRIARQVDVMTYLGEFTRSRLAPAVGEPATGRMARLSPGVDPAAFRPGGDGAQVRQKYELGRRPVILSVSRLVARKGQDTLIAALPAVRQVVPDATLLVVGAGPYEQRLRRLAARSGVADAIVFAGAVPHAQLPPVYAAADVFAMPCRTRRGGLEPEGLGIVFLEAAAAGLPVVVGDSGGAPEAVQDGQTGFVVDGHRPEQVATRLVQLLTDPDAAAAMGRQGRAWVQAQWTWDAAYQRLTQLLDGNR